MAVSPLMGIGSRAMVANQAVLSTISNNIANASTPGYSRQQAMLTTMPSQRTGQGYYGQGVDVQTVTRNHNDFLTSEAQRAGSLAAADNARSGQLAQLENVFPTGEQGVGYAANALMNSFVDVANNPQDSSARQVVLAKADELVNRFRSAGNQLDALQVGVSQDIETGVTAVNSLAKQLAGVNEQIARVAGSGHEPNDLLDKRDQLIAEIGKYIQVSTVPAENGQVNLFIGGGQKLVLGSHASPIKVVPDPYDARKVQMAVGEGGGPDPLVTLPADSLVGGSLAGLLRFQNHDLGDAKNLLGQMAAAVAGAVNKQQSLGLDLKNPAGAGAPIFATGKPEVLPASTNSRSSNGNYAASVNLTINDPTKLTGSDYTLQADPAATGTYLLTRVNDGLQRSIASGAQVDGMTVTVPNPAPAATDKYLLRPVASAAGTITRVIDDPLGIAAASPVQATVAATNTGTATVASLHAVDPSVNPNRTVSLAFSSDNGAYGWTETDATTNAVVATGTGTWTAGEPIAFNGVEMQLSGVPRSGDSFTVSKTRSSAANNGNAIAMVGLRDRPLVGRDASGAGGDTITNAYATALADVGVRVQTAKSTAATSAAVASQTEALRSSDSGVNLDEEAAKLIQFQQSYQAAAKVLSVAQTIFDTLLQATNG